MATGGTTDITRLQWQATLARVSGAVRQQAGENACSQAVGHKAVQKQFNSETIPVRNCSQIARDPLSDHVDCDGWVAKGSKTVRSVVQLEVPLLPLVYEAKAMAKSTETVREPCA